MSDQQQGASRRTRAVGAGLSAVGAGAGALGLAVGAKEIRRHGWRGTPRLTRALIPVEAAGLGGELMATKILHADAKQQKQPKEQTMVKSLGMDQGNGHGRRIVEVSKRQQAVYTSNPEHQWKAAGAAAGGGLVGAATGMALSHRIPRFRTANAFAGGVPGVLAGLEVGHRAGWVTKRPKKKNVAKGLPSIKVVRGAEKLGVAIKKPQAAPESIAAMRKRFRQSLQASVDNTSGVIKARGFNSEADRQRRLGWYAGAAGGGAIVAGEKVRHEFARSPFKRGGETSTHIGFKAGRTKRGLLLTGATTGLAALSAGTIKRGVSQRNQTWS